MSLITLVDTQYVLKNVLPDLPTMYPAAWTKYQLAATVQKDDEKFSTLLYGQASPGDYVVNLDDYIDGEDIVQQDLVCWLALGMMHIPIAEGIESELYNLLTIFRHSNSIFAWKLRQLFHSSTQFV
jgi:Cu2+-containing amine oxidase